MLRAPIFTFLFGLAIVLGALALSSWSVRDAAKFGAEIRSSGAAAGIGARSAATPGAVMPAPPAPMPAGPVPAAAALPPKAVAPQGAASAEQALYDQLTSKLRTANYSFNHPDSMLLGRRSQISLVLAADATAAVEKLKQQFDKQIEGGVTGGTTKVAPVMLAELRGRDFIVEPAGQQERVVLIGATGATEWTWFVEPRETGTDKLLVLTLYARLRGTDKLPPLNVQTFQARVNVDVRTLDLVIDQARRLTPISQVLTGVGGLIALLGFVGTLRRWWRGTNRPLSK